MDERVLSAEWFMFSDCLLLLSLFFSLSLFFFFRCVASHENLANLSLSEILSQYSVESRKDLLNFSILWGDLINWSFFFKRRKITN